MKNIHKRAFKNTADERRGVSFRTWFKANWRDMSAVISSAASLNVGQTISTTVEWLSGNSSR